MSLSPNQLEMRNLWFTHGQLLMIYVATNQDNQMAQALQQNRMAISNFIGQFATAGAQMVANLLKQHIQFAELLTAAIRRNKTVAGQAFMNDLFQNAANIAGLLSQANPTVWPFSLWQQILDNYLNVTILEIQLWYQGDLTGSLAQFNTNVVPSLNQIADTLSAGLF